MPEPNDIRTSPSEASTLTKLRNAIDGLTKLTIRTVIDGDGGERSMRTVIDLVDGDIENTIHQDFVSGELKGLRDFHEAQVHKGQEIIKNNIAALKAIFELVKDTAPDRRVG
jgi:hypothetical protein